MQTSRTKDKDQAFKHKDKNMIYNLWPSAGFGVVRIDPLCFLARCRTRRLNQVLSVYILACFLALFCLLVVLVKLSVLAKSLAITTLLMKPNCGEGIVSTKPSPKSVYDFLGLLCC